MLFSEVLDDLEKQYKNYDEPIKFNISKFDESGSNFLNIRRKIVSELPIANELEQNMIYSFYHENGYHSIYSYRDGFIFNPNSERYPLVGYNDIFSVQFEPSYYYYNKFWEFMGMTRNLSGVMHSISEEENCDEWCVLAAYLHNKGYSMKDFVVFVEENGEYKKLEFNMIHYLCIFISYVYLNMK